MSDDFQPSLEYVGTTGFVADSDTSRDHADVETQRAGKIQKVVHDLIATSHAKGATSAEIEEWTGLKHQTVSSAIRNMELDGYVEGESTGRVVKLATRRNGSHPYITSSLAALLTPSATLPPNRRRESYAKRYNALLAHLQEIVDAEAPMRSLDVGDIANADVLAMRWHRVVGLIEGLVLEEQ